MNLPDLFPAPTAANLRPRQLLRAVLAVWDRLAIYLPMVLMAVLALLTYWMVRLAPQLAEPQEPQPKTHEVDFFMRGATMRTYDKDGRLQSQLFGAEMRHYDDSATVEVDHPRWKSTAPDGRVTHATARLALSRDDGSELQLFNNAVVVRDALTTARSGMLPRQEFRGDFLHVFAKDERMLSHLPVRFFSGQDEFSGESFRYDHLNRMVELEGRAKARIMPRATPSQPSSARRP